MTSIRAMVEECPRMKALHDFLVAGPHDSDRKWAEYVALAPDLAGFLNPYRDPAVSSSASSTSCSPASTSVESHAVLSIEGHTTADDLTPEARRIYDLLVGGSAAPVLASPDVATMLPAPTVFDVAPAATMPASCSTLGPCPVMGAIQASVAPLLASDVLLKDPAHEEFSLSELMAPVGMLTPVPAPALESSTAFEPSPRSAPWDNLKLATMPPTTCSTGCSGHDAPALVSALTSSTAPSSSTTTKDVGPELTAHVIAEAPLLVEDASPAVPTRAEFSHSSMLLSFPAPRVLDIGVLDIVNMTKLYAAASREAVKIVVLSWVDTNSRGLGNGRHPAWPPPELQILHTPGDKDTILHYPGTWREKQYHRLTWQYSRCKEIMCAEATQYALLIQAPILYHSEIVELKVAWLLAVRHAADVDTFKQLPIRLKLDQAMRRLSALFLGVGALLVWPNFAMIPIAGLCSEDMSSLNYPLPSTNSGMGFMFCTTGDAPFSNSQPSQWIIAWWISSVSAVSDDTYMGHHTGINFMSKLTGLKNGANARYGANVLGNIASMLGYQCYMISIALACSLIHEYVIVIVCCFLAIDDHKSLFVAFLALPWDPGQQASVGPKYLTSIDLTAAICARTLTCSWSSVELKACSLPLICKNTNLIQPGVAFRNEMCKPCDNGSIQSKKGFSEYLCHQWPIWGLLQYGCLHGLPICRIPHYYLWLSTFTCDSEISTEYWPSFNSLKLEVVGVGLCILDIDIPGSPCSCCLFTKINMTIGNMPFWIVLLPWDPGDFAVVSDGVWALHELPHSKTVKCFWVYLVQQTMQRTWDPDQSQLDMPLDDLPPLRLRDMVFSATTTHETMSTCLERIVESAKCSSGLILNTFNDLEGSELQKITDGISVPVFAIGPLHKISSGAESSLLAQDRSCLEWLDKQEAESVLYVSFGSLASMDQDELVEIAWGLANSRMPFLWVIRANLVNCSEKMSLPDGFNEATCGRGMVVSWAPQQEVLGHRAVGGFWTHNGWNSTLESICEGVPMICKPHFADQMINMRYVQEVWKTGFELEGKMERRKIERDVRKLMCEEEGTKMRQRAKDLKNKAVKCIEKEGSSKTAIDLLVNCIMSF